MAQRYYSDDKVDEIHWELQKEISKKKHDPIKNIPPITLFLLIGAVILSVYLGVTKGVQITKLLFMIAIFVGIAFFLGNRGSTNELLTEQQCKDELYYQLKYKQRNPLGRFQEIPDGEIQIDLQGKLRWFDGRPWKRYTGFKVITSEGLPEEYYAAQDPYSGDIIEAKPCPEGFDISVVSKDIVMIAPPELMRERRWTEYGGKLQ